jgi:hypothetical protein
MKLRLPWQSALLLTGLVLVPACGGGGGGGGGLPPGPDPAQSRIEVSTLFGTPADGTSTVQVTVTVRDTTGNALQGIPVELRVTGYDNLVVQPPSSDVDGLSAGSLASTVGEPKTITVVASPGAGEIQLGSVGTEFVRILPNTFFVRASGSDANGGTSPVDAWATLPYALTRLAAGDTLHVGAGTYEPIRVTVSATASQPLQLLADRSGMFTGDAGDVLIEAGGGTHGIQLDGASHVVVGGFSIRGAAPGAGAGGGVWIGPGASSDCAIHECSLYENDRGLDVAAASSLVVEANRVSANLGDGLRFGTTSDARVQQNLVYSNGGAGMALEGTSSNLTVGLNTFYRNVGDQFAERAGLSVGSITGNVLSEGMTNGLMLLSLTNLTPNHNLSWAHPGGELRVPPPTNVIADPMFVDPAGPDGILGGAGALDDDFRLGAGSGAFDAGEIDARDFQLTFSGPASTLTSRPSGVRDGEAPDGPELNLGFHYPAQLEPFASTMPGAGRLAYVLPGEVTVRTRARTVAGAFDAPVRALDANSEVKWVVHRVSPKGPEELTAVLSDTGSEAALHVRHWTGRMWSQVTGGTILNAIQSADTDERGFDLAFESSSGDALLVHADGDANPTFRTLENGVWSEAAPVFGAAPGAGKVLWAELVPDSGSDRVALVVLDDQNDLSAAVWNGSSWTNPILLETGVVTAREFRAFDLAWESLSGELLVVWGFSIFAERARIATLDPAGGSWQVSEVPSTEAIGAVVELASDPTSDRIVAAFGEGNEDDDVAVSMWDGDAFTDTAELTLRGVFAQRSIEVGWIGETGKAFAVWRDPGQAGTFMYARFNSGWRVEGALLSGVIGSARQVEVKNVPGGDHAEVVVLDSNGALMALQVTWNGAGSVWSVKNGGAPLGTGLDPDASTRPFSYDLRRP